MIRTVLSLSFVALVATAVLWTVRETNATSIAASETCPCGSCVDGCTCCVDPEVDCDSCECGSCECGGCVTPFAANGKALTCCLVEDSSCCLEEPGAACCAEGEQSPPSEEGETLASVTELDSQVSQP